MRPFKRYRLPDITFCRYCGRRVSYKAYTRAHAVCREIAMRERTGSAHYAAQEHVEAVTGENVDVKA